MKNKNNQLNLLFITADPDVASFVVDHGVNRVFVDLEILGKDERQGHLDTVISRHTAEDISRLRPLLPKGALLVRLNPVNPNTENEVEDAISRGADVLMLPMFRKVDEVRRFCEAVNLRAKVCLLVETVDAMKNLAKCIEVAGVNEVHIGLNDLHLEMGCGFMFELLITGHVERMAETLRNANIPFGIGGLARIGEGMLPAEMILSEHVRLGSTCAILSRTFHRQARSVAEIELEMDFSEEVQKLRAVYKVHCGKTQAELNHENLNIRTVIADIASKRSISKRQETRGF